MKLPNIGGVFSSIISLRVLAGIAVGGFTVLGVLLWMTSGKLDNANETIRVITVAVAEAAGMDKVAPKDAPARIREVAAKRDVYLRERDGYKQAVESQTTAIQRLETETAAARVQANKASREVQRVVKERNKWIAEANSRSTRTERAALEEEARLMEEALDALYEDGF